MNVEEDPPRKESREQTTPPAQDAAAKAMAQAKAGLSRGVTEFKRLDRMGRIFLGGLGIVLVFGFVFSALAYPDLEAIRRTFGYVPDHRPLSSMGNPGTLMMLAALGGIGLFVWNLKSAVKQTWMPMALAGCAAVALLAILIATSGGSGDGAIKVSRTILGFWLPLLGAAGATWASGKPLLDARATRPAPPRPEGSKPPPPPPPMD